MSSYRDHLWFLLDQWIHEVENIGHHYDSQLFLLKKIF